MSVRTGMTTIKFWQMRVKSLQHCIQVCECAGNQYGAQIKAKLYIEARDRLRRLRA